MNTERPDIAQSSGVPPEDYGAFAEVMESMTPSENLVVEQIASSVNSRVAAMAGAAPATPFYASPGVIVTGCALVAGLVTWAVWPSSDAVNQSVAENPNEIVVEDTQPQPTSGGNDFVMNPAVDSTQHSDDAMENTTEDPVVSPGNQTNSTVDAGGTANNDNTAASTTDPNQAGNTGDDGTAAGAATTDMPDTTGKRMTPDDTPYFGGGLDPSGPTYTNSTYMGTNETLIVNVKVMQKMGLDNPMKMEDMPSFYGGDKGIEKYVRDEVKKSLLSNPRLKGQSCVVSFVVNQKGKVSDKQIVSADSGALRAEVERIFTKMPNWQKGSKKGKISVMIALTFDEIY